MIPGTGILRSIDSNATFSNEEHTELSSSSHISTSGSGSATANTSTNSAANTSTGSGSNNSSLATTMDLSLNNGENANTSHSSDGIEVDSHSSEQPPTKKARLSHAVVEMLNRNDAVANDPYAGAATVSRQLFENVHKANLCFEQELKQKIVETERLKHQIQVLTDENGDLTKRLEETKARIANAETAAQQQTEQHAPQQINRMAAIAFAKATKVCMACNAERPLGEPVCFSPHSVT